MYRVSTIFLYLDLHQVPLIFPEVVQFAIAQFSFLLQLRLVIISLIFE
jgi:hypothetical protein